MAAEMQTIGSVEKLAHRLLDLNPDPIPRFRILRDILRVSEQNPDYITAKGAVGESRFVRELAESQDEDGNWGRFHARHSREKRKFPGTEIAVARALAVGLDKESSVLQRTIGFIESHMMGDETWSGPAEKSDNPDLWEYIIKFISAANLSLIHRDHPMLSDMAGLLSDATHAAFDSGEYDRDRELAVHVKASGIESEHHLACHIKYGLLLLSTGFHQLSEAVETGLLQSVLQRPDGIYYTYGSRLLDLPAITDRLSRPIENETGIPS